MTDQSISHGNSATGHATSNAVENGLSLLGNVAEKARSIFGAGIQNMQFSRMVGVLNAMSDSDLEKIELKRSDIRAHAAEMVGMSPR